MKNNYIIFFLDVQSYPEELQNSSQPSFYFSTILISVKELKSGFNSKTKLEVVLL